MTTNTKQISKIINYTKHYDTSLWGLDCLYCKKHNPEQPIDTWYDCDECCKEFNDKPKEYILKQRFKMKLIRNVLVVASPITPKNIILDKETGKSYEMYPPDPENGFFNGTAVEVDEVDIVDEKEEIKPFFYIKGIHDLNKFMKDGRKYLERNIGIKFDTDFCKSVQKKFYEDKDIGMEDLVFKIDFSKAKPTTKTGALFLYILISGQYTLDQLIGKAITNTLEEIND